MGCVEEVGCVEGWEKFIEGAGNSGRGEGAYYQGAILGRGGDKTEIS